MFVYLSETGLTQIARRFVYGITPSGIQGLCGQSQIHHPIVNFCLDLIRFKKQIYSHVVKSGGF